MAKAKAKEKEVKEEAPVEEARTAEDIQAEMASLQAELEEVAPEVAKQCPSVNKHSLDVYGNRDNLQCELEKGHDGPHSAQHHQITTQLSPHLSGEEMDLFSQIEVGDLPKDLQEKFTVWITRKNNDGSISRTMKPVYEGNPVVHWNDMAEKPVDEINPVSPGIEFIEYDVDEKARLLRLHSRQ